MFVLTKFSCWALNLGCGYLQGVVICSAVTLWFTAILYCLLFTTYSCIHFVTFGTYFLVTSITFFCYYHPVPVCFSALAFNRNIVDIQVESGRSKIIDLCYWAIHHNAWCIISFLLQAELQLNFQKRRGHGLLSVIRPKFSGMLGEALDIAARWSGDVVSIPFLFFLHFLSLVCYYHILKNSMLLSYFEKQYVTIICCLLSLYEIWCIDI